VSAIHVEKTAAETDASVDLNVMPTEAIWSRVRDVLAPLKPFDP
jgi:hypothetical protein